MSSKIGVQIDLLLQEREYLVVFSMRLSLNFLGTASTTSRCFIEILLEIQILPNLECFTIIKGDEFW